MIPILHGQVKGIHVLGFEANDIRECFDQSCHAALWVELANEMQFFDIPGED